MNTIRHLEIYIGFWGNSYVLNRLIICILMVWTSKEDVRNSYISKRLETVKKY
ncbi:hypothetical protein KHA80_04070 [Anaerobacillus sp. HL2]|nr:hypothetical protein KHA80_04070 [Anaerobacillus sp. HL2]